MTFPAQTQRSIEHRGGGNHGVIFAAFTTRIDPEPREFRQETAREPPSKPGVVEKLGARSHDHGIRAGRDPFLEQLFGRRAPEWLDRGHPVNCALALRPSAMLLEQDVAEDHMRNGVGRERFERSRKRGVVRLP